MQTIFVLSGLPLRQLYGYISYDKDNYAGMTRLRLKLSVGIVFLFDAEIIYSGWRTDTSLVGQRDEAVTFQVGKVILCPCVSAHHECDSRYNGLAHSHHPSNSPLIGLPLTISSLTLSWLTFFTHLPSSILSMWQNPLIALIFYPTNILLWPPFSFVWSFSRFYFPSKSCHSPHHFLSNTPSLHASSHTQVAPSSYALETATPSWKTFVTLYTQLNSNSVSDWRS